jgi:hypothetical protein
VPDRGKVLVSCFPVICPDIYPYIIISPAICPDIYPYIIIPPVICPDIYPYIIIPPVICPDIYLCFLLHTPLVAVLLLVNIFSNIYVYC